jgi:hypothetical protein
MVRYTEQKQGGGSERLQKIGKYRTKKERRKMQLTRDRL